MKKFGKKLVLLPLAALLVITPLNADAACKNWTYNVSSNFCQSPRCGPGGVLYNKYESGVKIRACTVNGKQKKEKVPYSKRTGRCCSK